MCSHNSFSNKTNSSCVVLHFRRTLFANRPTANKYHYFENNGEAAARKELVQHLRETINIGRE